MGRFQVTVMLWAIAVVLDCRGQKTLIPLPRGAAAM
jgi:hypothetical protein